MNKEASISRDLFYTKDHEWIDFQGQVAFIGVCSFKLIGFKEIHEIIFNEPMGFKKQGDVVATIRYNDYKIEAHMPVAGKVVEVNDKLNLGDSKFLLQYAESIGWVAMIFPMQPTDRKELMVPKTYHLTNKYNRDPKIN